MRSRETQSVIYLGTGCGFLVRMCLGRFESAFEPVCRWVFGCVVYSLVRVMCARYLHILSVWLSLSLCLSLHARDARI